MKTVCCSVQCVRQGECANHAINNEGMNCCEGFYSFGSGSISTGGLKENFWCGELGNWGMFVPIEKIDMEVKIPFPFHYLNQYIRGESDWDSAFDNTMEEVYSLIEDYVAKHLKT